MPSIKILPQELINKIAAGEVVERPASVVKELIDNAYDARASQITISIEEGGIKKIHITDNGIGMSAEDAEIAFQAHATSKISSEDDLFNIRNYGFRGEALSSIAAVSKVTLRTKQQADNLGIEIKIEGGELKSKNETGAQAGTSIVIEDLFYNVPARKEFLKASQSEYKAILEIVNSYAIANAEIGVTFINNGKVVYSFPKGHQIEDRVREIMGHDVYEKLIPIFYEHPHIEIYGFTGKPEIATERRKNQYIFVNKRIVSNKSIAFAVKNAYSSLIPQNSNPPYIILIDVAPNIVDVNVHPRKEEVKFSNEGLIFDAVKSAIKKALDKVDLTPGSDNNKTPFGASPFTQRNSMDNPFGNRPTPFPRPEQKSRNTPFPPFSPPGAIRGEDRNQQSKPPSFADTFWDKPFTDESDPIENIPKNTGNKLNILKIHNLYLVTESEDGILIYDQHAVHERIIYEKLINKHKNEKDENSAQKLMVPVIVNLSIEENESMKENIDAIRKTGFEIEEFGPNTYKINQVPSIALNLNIKDLFHELLEDIENENDKKTADSQSNKILTFMSCRMAYKAGDNIPLEEAARLIEDLDKSDIKYTCPHGRPVKVEITLKELSKMFKRT